MRAQGVIAALAVFMLFSSAAVCIFSDEDSSAAEQISGSLSVDPGASVSKTLSATEMTAQRNSAYFQQDNGVAPTIKYEIDPKSYINGTTKSIAPIITFSGTAPTEPGTYLKIVTVGLKQPAGNGVLVSCQFKLTVTVNQPKATYTVSFSVDGGTSCDPMDVQEGSSIILPSTTRADYKFEGWYDANKKVGDAGISYTPTGSVTLYALWSSTVITTYTVTFQSNGGSQCAIQTVSQNSSITLPNTSKTGCTFEGWFTQGGDKVGGAGSSYTPVASVTLYAHWSQIAQYKVTFNTNGGTTVDTKTCDAGSEITLPSVTKPNSSFIGWFTSTGVEVKSPYRVVGDITLYAHWTTYEITISSPSEDYQFSTTLRSNGVIVTDVNGIYNWYLDGVNVQNSSLNKYQVQTDLSDGQHTIKVIVELTSVSPSVTVQDELAFLVSSIPGSTPDLNPDSDLSDVNDNNDVIVIVIAVVTVVLGLIAISRII